MCCEAVDAEALWKRRPTKPMSGKFPYYFLRGLCFFFPTSCFIISKRAHTHTHTHKKETTKTKTPHASYAARARAARRAIYVTCVDVIINSGKELDVGDV